MSQRLQKELNSVLCSATIDTAWNNHSLKIMGVHQSLNVLQHWVLPVQIHDFWGEKMWTQMITTTS